MIASREANPMEQQYPGYSPPPPYQPQYAQSGRTNGLAIASMVLGIVWLWWVGSALALIFGFIALNQIRQRGESGKGMAIAGIVLGAVGAVTFLGMILLISLGSSSSGQ